MGFGGFPVKLALGTVQFGLDYGIANHRGRVPADEVKQILQMARNAGVDTLDTAVGYGDSETVLGHAGVDGFRVITKVGGLPKNIKNRTEAVVWLRAEVARSCARLGKDQIDGLLLHRPEQLMSEAGAWLAQALHAVRDEGLVRKIGFSIYSPDALASLCHVVQPDLVQAPMSLVDQRLITSGWLDQLASEGVEVHVRSVFLQGLLLQRQSELPNQFAPWRPVWQRWQQWLADTKRDALSSCIHFAISQPAVSRVVVGVDSVSQFKQIVESARDTAISQAWPVLACEDEQLINPSLWSSA